MVQAVLVTYASKHGSTKEVAEAIGATLRALGSKVDVVAADDVKDFGWV
jgi:menaquinone-dependent protoporphyrinogen IX oxidase